MFNEILAGFYLMKKIPHLTSLFIVCLFFSISLQAIAYEKLTFVVHPYKKAKQLQKMFKPLLNNLEKQLGNKIIFRTSTSYDKVIDLYKQGKADFGYLGPAGYVAAADSVVVKPMVRILSNGTGTFRGVIVVKKDSGIKSIKELKGGRFAFGDHTSTLSHFVPHYMLLQENVSLDKLSKYAFTGKHDNVAKGVLLGLFDAGGLKPAVASKYLDKGLRILATSESISEHLFVASKSLDKSMQDKIKKALLKTDLSALQSIKKNITGLELVNDSDYDNLRKIIKTVNKQKFHN